MPFYLLKPILTGRSVVNGFLSPDECHAIIAAAERGLLKAGTTEDRRTQIRESDIAWLSPEGEHQKLFEEVRDGANSVNPHSFGYQLIGFERIQFTQYSGGQESASYTIHEVTPVTKGTRYSLVGRACGPAFT